MLVWVFATLPNEHGTHHAGGPASDSETNTRLIGSAHRWGDSGRAIVRRYVEAYDPGAALADYLLDGGVIVRLEPDAIRAWDYADATYV